MLKYWILLFGLGSAFAAYINIKKRKSCFVIWTITNIGQMVAILAYKATDFYGQLPQWIVFSILNVYGWLEWRKEEKK